MDGTLGLYQSYSGSLPVSAIKNDLADPGTLIIAYGSSIILRKTVEDSIVSDFISGLYITAGNEDGIYPQSRITAPVCMAQPDLNNIILVEKYCLKSVNKIQLNTTTLAGSCVADSQLTSAQGGQFSTARFTELKTCALRGGSSLLFVVDKLHKVYSVALHLKVVGTSASDSQSYYNMILPTFDQTMFYTLTEDRRLISVNSLGITTHEAFKASSAVLPELKDGTGLQAQLTALPEEVPTSYIDYYGELIITAESRGVIRVVDLATSQAPFVSSICSNLGDPSRIDGDILSCGASEINAVFMGHTTQKLYIATEEYGVLQFNITRDLEGE